MPKVFVSYRRDDSASFAGRLFDRLHARFGRASVFMDVDSIPLGVDFRDRITEAVQKCDVLLAVIGAGWDAPDAAGVGRLKDPTDFVRIEIEAALARDVPVIPILVGRRGMPGEGELPSSLRLLAYRNACRIDPGSDFHAGVDRLIRILEQPAGGTPDRADPGETTGNPDRAGPRTRDAARGRLTRRATFGAVAAGVVLVALGIGFALRSHRDDGHGEVGPQPTGPADGARESAAAVTSVKVTAYTADDGVEPNASLHFALFAEDPATSRADRSASRVRIGPEQVRGGLLWKDLNRLSVLPLASTIRVGEKGRLTVRVEAGGDINWHVMFEIVYETSRGELRRTRQREIHFKDAAEQTVLEFTW